MTLERTTIIREIRGKECRCGQKKQVGRSFCSACYYSLLQKDRDALYRPFGEGYEEAFQAALLVLVEKGRINP